MNIEKSPETTWLSVVTVVRNDLEGFSATVRSLAQQDLSRVQFIVVDSSDDAGEIKGILKNFPEVSFEYHWVPAEGIYSAMNNGLRVARGDYIHFANAGDVYYSSSTLYSLRQQVIPVTPEWVIGRISILSEHGDHVVTPTINYRREKKRLFARGIFPAHQGTLIRTELLRSLGGFDTGYLIAADYHAALRMSVISDPLVLSEVIMVFKEGGTSTRQWRESFREFHRARKNVFRPRGVSSMREYLDSYMHAGKVWFYRDVLERFATQRKGRDVR